MGQSIYTEKEAHKDYHLIIDEMERTRRNDERTKYSIAKGIGVNQSSVTRILNHTQSPSVMTFIKMIKLLGGKIVIRDKMFL